MLSDYKTNEKENRVISYAVTRSTALSVQSNSSTHLDNQRVTGRWWLA